MSEAVRCDCCGKEGRRQRRKIAPDDWSYVEVEEDDGFDSLIIYACSEPCERMNWQKGPGHLEFSGNDEFYLDIIAQREGRWGEKGVTLQEGDVLVYGAVRFEIGPGGVLRLTAGNVVGDQIVP